MIRTMSYITTTVRTNQTLKTGAQQNYQRAAKCIELHKHKEECCWIGQLEGVIPETFAAFEQNNFRSAPYGNEIDAEIQAKLFDEGFSLNRLYREDFHTVKLTAVRDIIEGC